VARWDALGCPDLEKWLDQWGILGWELIHVASNNVCTFKQEII
jgi:hypothetical protein